MMTPTGTATFPKHRREDDRLITGLGRFADDFDVEGQAYGAFVRSDHAHGIIKAIELDGALNAPGVIGILTGDDLQRAGVGRIKRLPLAGYKFSREIETPRPGLAIDRVRYVGEPLALVVAESAAQAGDAATLISVEIEPLPCVINVEEAVLPGAPVIWPAASDNVAISWSSGDTAEIDATFAAAAHVTRLKLLNSRLFANPIEPRSSISIYHKSTESFEWITPSQGSEYMLRVLADQVFCIPDSKIHIRTYDVGGAFGVKEQPYPEDVALLHAARVFERPVKWRGTRAENLLSDNHARDTVMDCALAVGNDGRFLGIRTSISAAMGSYFACNGPNASIRNTSNGLPQVYRTPLSHTNVDCIMTNTAPVGPYRGAGREQASYIVERLVDETARQLGIDRIELRRMNLIPPSAIPYKTPSGRIYDSGEFERILDKALLIADWNGYSARKKNSEQAGKIRGLGIACFMECVGGFPNEGADIRFTADGRVLLVVATQSQGQSHETTFPQVVADKLGIPYERVELRQGDSHDKPLGFATVGSRSMIMAGSALSNACDVVIEKGRRAASHILEVGETDVEFKGGDFRVVGTDRSISLLDIVTRVSSFSPATSIAKTLDSTGYYKAPDFHFPNGCHVSEVEIDPDDGTIQVLRYTAVDDVGNMINPHVVHGQVHGGVAQGLGQVLMEQCLYNDDGQFLTGSFMDYAMPRANNIPTINADFHPVPSPKNPLGVKGAGECGVTGAVPCLMNAIADALASVGANPEIDMPVTSEKLWVALRSRKTVLF